jgi:hypothetical protein
MLPPRGASARLLRGRLSARRPLAARADALDRFGARPGPMSARRIGFATLAGLGSRMLPPRGASARSLCRRSSAAGNRKAISAAVRRRAEAGEFQLARRASRAQEAQRGRPSRWRGASDEEHREHCRSTSGAGEPRPTTSASSAAAISWSAGKRVVRRTTSPAHAKQRRRPRHVNRSSTFRPHRSQRSTGSS